MNYQDYKDFDQFLNYSAIYNAYHCPRCHNSDIFEVSLKYFLRNHPAEQIELGSSLHRIVYLKCDRCGHEGDLESFKGRETYNATDNAVRRAEISSTAVSTNSTEAEVILNYLLKEISKYDKAVEFCNSIVLDNIIEDGIVQFKFKDESQLEITRDPEFPENYWVRYPGKEWRSA